MGSDKLTKDEVQKQMYIEIKNLKEQVANYDDKIEYNKDSKKDSIKETLMHGLKVLGIFTLGSAITLGLFYGFGTLALTLPENYWRVVVGLTPASLGLGATIGLMIEPIKDMIDSITDIQNSKYEQELQEDEKKPYAEKLNMLENMNDEEAKKYVKHKLSKDKTMLESFVYYHNKKNEAKTTKQKPVTKTVETNEDSPEK